MGGGVSAPALLYKVEPEYSEEARKAKYQGTVVLYVEVDTSGKARNLRVLRSLGLGLDEKAIEAVQKWRFRPGQSAHQRPAILKLETMVGGRLQVIEIDAAEQPEIASQWGVFSVPTTFLIDASGKPRHVNYGVASADKLLNQVQGLL